MTLDMVFFMKAIVDGQSFVSPVACFLFSVETSFLVCG